MTVQPGDLVWFRATGSPNPPRPAKVLPAGRLGQTYITLVTDTGEPIPGGLLAVCPTCELRAEKEATR